MTLVARRRLSSRFGIDASRRVRGRSASALPLLVVWMSALAAAECLAMHEAHAWDPIRSASRSAATGLAEGATPILEAAGHNLLDDVNGKMAARIDQLQGSLTGALGQLDGLRKSGLDQVDGIMQARIAQLGGVANVTVASAIGGLDRVAKDRIAQAEQSGATLIQLLSKEESAILDRANDILEQRIGQLDDIVARSLDDVDEVLRQRIEQVDELTERRLANADVMVTRQGVALEKSLLQAGQWLALLGFGIYVCIKGYQDFDVYWDEQEKRGLPLGKGLLYSIGKALPWLLLRVVAAGVCVALVYLFVTRLPTQSEDRLAALTHQNVADFQRSCESLDFPKVRFYESQLELLEKDDGKRARYNYEVRKYEIARNVLGRAALLKTAQGVRDLISQLRALESPKQPDADLLALQAYVYFRSSQASESRDGEALAAEFAQRALALTNAAPSAVDISLEPVFKPLATAVLRALLEDPVPDSAIAKSLPALRAALGSATGENLSLLKQADAYNQAVSQLNRRSSSAFARLLEAQARLQKESQGMREQELRIEFDRQGRVVMAGLNDKQRAVATAMDLRKTAASELVNAWTTFDATLNSDRDLENSSAVFAAFTLNDAVLTQALWVERNPSALTLAPPLKQVIPPKLRAEVTPVRIAWARRYGGSLGRGTNWMFGFEEARRYERYEEQVQELTAAYLELEAPSKPQPKGKSADKTEQPGTRSSPQLRAAIAAAALGLYVGEADKREAFGLKLLGERASPNERELVLAEYRRRHLQYL